MSDKGAAVPSFVIRPPRRVELNLREAWHYRDLLYFLVWRELKVRYKQTIIGAAWAVIQPVVTMILFVVVFGRMAAMPAGGIPYPVFFYTAIVAWTYFAQAIAAAAQSTVEHQQLITKVYFPRLLLPLAGVLAPLVDLAIGLVVLIGLMVAYRVVPAWTLALAPAFLIMASLTALGVGLWLAALNARYRDVRYALPFAIQLWMFASPVAYPTAIVPEAWRPWFGLNPMAGIIEGFRWAVLGRGVAPGPLLLVSAGISLLVLVSGVLYFQRTEQILADVV
jgi:lipopolysaccharide transport system permease protein